MRQRLPDIKTVDTFFEVFSDQEKFMSRMAEMRVIRDEIKKALGTVDTKTKADKLFTQAQSANATATALLDQAKTTHDSNMAELKKAKDKHKASSAAAAKSNGAFRKALDERETALNKAQADFETTMVSRETVVAKREDEVTRREVDVLTRETSTAAFAKRLEKAVQRGGQ